MVHTSVFSVFLAFQHNDYGPPLTNTRAVVYSKLHTPRRALRAANLLWILRQRPRVSLSLLWKVRRFLAVPPERHVQEHVCEPPRAASPVPAALRRRWTDAPHR